MPEPLTITENSFHIEESDHFEVWYLPGHTVLDQIHGKLTISKNGLSLANIKGQNVFDLPHSSIQTVRVDDMHALYVMTSSKNYRLSFYNPQLVSAKLVMFGLLWASGGKNGPFSARGQQLCAYAAESLRNKKYEVTKKPPVSMAQALLILLAILLILGVFTFLTYNHWFGFKL